MVDLINFVLMKVAYCTLLTSCYCLYVHFIPPTVLRLLAIRLLKAVIPRYMAFAGKCFAGLHNTIKSAYLSALHNFN